VKSSSNLSRGLLLRTGMGRLRTSSYISSQLESISPDTAGDNRTGTAVRLLCNTSQVTTKPPQPVRIAEAEMTEERQQQETGTSKARVCTDKHGGNPECSSLSRPARTATTPDNSTRPSQRTTKLLPSSGCASLESAASEKERCRLQQCSELGRNKSARGGRL